MIIFLVHLVEPCSDQFVKRMAVKVCSLEKRSFSSSNEWPILGLNFGNSDNFEHQFTRLIEVVDEINKLFMIKSSVKKSQGKSNLLLIII